jgi:hypothetical protein
MAKKSMIEELKELVKKYWEYKRVLSLRNRHLASDYVELLDENKELKNRLIVSQTQIDRFCSALSNATIDLAKAVAEKKEQEDLNNKLSKENEQLLHDQKIDSWIVEVKNKRIKELETEKEIKIKLLMDVLQLFAQASSNNK